MLLLHAVSRHPVLIVFPFCSARVVFRSPPLSVPAAQGAPPVQVVEARPRRRRRRARVPLHRGGRALLHRGREDPLGEARNETANKRANRPRLPSCSQAHRTRSHAPAWAPSSLPWRAATRFSLLTHPPAPPPQVRRAHHLQLGDERAVGRRSPRPRVGVFAERWRRRAPALRLPAGRRGALRARPPRGSLLLHDQPGRRAQLQGRVRAGGRLRGPGGVGGDSGVSLQL